MIYLVCLKHASQDVLVHKKFQGFLNQTVRPLIEKNAVLIIEGGEVGEVTFGHSQYSETLAMLGWRAEDFEHPPILYSSDVFYKITALDEIPRAQAETLSFMEEAWKHARLKVIPESWEHIHRIIKMEEKALNVNRKGLKPFRAIAQKIQRRTRLRDIDYTKTILRYARQGKEVFFFGGGSHALVLHRNYGWPILSQDLTKSELHDLTLSHLLFNYAGNLVSRGK